jgi:CO dehydrogenase maturation factor
MWLAVAGKGGAGKSTIAGTLARVVARRGTPVLALDSDMQPGLAASLGAAVPDEPPLNAAAERTEEGRWRLRKGIGPVRAVERYSTPAPDGVRLLQAGKTSPEGLAAVLGAIHAFHRLVHRLDRRSSLGRWTIVGDLPAGPRQLAFDWAPYAERVLLVVEPSWKSVLAARRSARVAPRGADVALVVSKAAGDEDVAWVEERMEMPALAAVPLDAGVEAAERRGVAPLDHAPDGPFVAAVERLADRLEDG